MSFLKNCLKGIAIGSGAILPGISSGVFCVIFGIYEKLLDSVLNFTKDIKGNIRFLSPIILGGILGFFIFGNILNFCLYKFPIQSNSIFIGLILGSIPQLLKDVHQKAKFKISYFLFFLIALTVGIFLIFLEKYLSVTDLQNVSTFYLIFSGFCMSVGIIVPGVSSTIILMLLGVYSLYLNSVSALFLPVLVPLALGIFFGSFCFMKLTKFLLDCFYAPTFYCIIGFTIGSIFILLPSCKCIVDVFIAILCVILRFLYFFCY